MPLDYDSYIIKNMEYVSAAAMISDSSVGILRSTKGVSVLRICLSLID